MKKKILLILLLFVCNPNLLQCQFQIFNSHSGYYVDGVPAIAQNSNGKIVIVWADLRHSKDFGDGTMSTTDIYCQFYDKFLNPVGGNIRVPEPGLADYYIWFPAVSIDKSNNIIVAFEAAYREEDYSTKLFYNKYNFDGDIFKESVRISDADSSSQRFTSATDGTKLIQFDNGNYIFNFSKSFGSSDLGDQRNGNYIQFFDSLDNKVGKNVLLEKKGETFLIKLNEDKFAIVVDHQYFQIYSSKFLLLKNWVDMGSNPEFEWPHVIEAYNDSTFIFSYLVGDVSIRLYNIYSHTQTPKKIIFENTAGYLNGWSNSAKGPNGELVIIWQDGRNFIPWDADDADIYAQILDAKLIKIGDNFKLNHEEREYVQSWPRVISRGFNFLSVWTEYQRHPTCTGDPDTTTSGIHNIISGVQQEFANPVPGKIFGLDDLNKFCNGYPTFFIKQNFPNPFNSTSQLDFKLFKSTNVNITIYNISGQKISTLLNENLEGDSQLGVEHHLTFTMPDNSASGLYFIRFSALGETQTVKTLFLK